MSRLPCLQSMLIASFVFFRLGPAGAQVTDRQARQIRANVAAGVSQHPFLLVRKEQYEELRQRAERSPWKQMREAAIALAGRTIPAEQWNTPHILRNVVSAASLAYVLDPERRDEYRKKIFEGLDVVKTLRIGGPDFSRQVPPGIAVVNLILALDIVHDDLAPEQLAAAEATLGECAGKFDRGWEWNLYTVRALWALYRGDEPGFAKNRDTEEARCTT